MSNSATVKPDAAPVREDVLAILGTELLLLGGLAAVIAGRVRPEVVVAVGGAIGLACGLLSEVRHAAWRPTARAVAALYCSFASTVPGMLFFIELLNRNGVACYDRPW